MSLPVKRQHDETAATLKGIDGKHHATGEPPATVEGALDSRPTKFARLEREGEKGSSEPMGSLPKREGAALEVTLGELHGETKEVKDGREIKSKMRERGRDFLPEVKIDRDGRAGEIRDSNKVERDLKDLRGDGKAEREVARHGWGAGAAKDGVRESKEFMVDRDGRDSRVGDSKGERDLKELRGGDVKVERDVGRHAWGQVDVKERLREGKDLMARYVKVEEAWVPVQDSGNSKDENVDVQSKKSPREDEGKSREPKEFSELKWEDQEKDERKENENEKKEEKRGDRKEDTHLNVTEQNEIEREEKEKIEKEKEKEKSRDRERSREKEKEGAARGEKREKREKDKERDRDVQRRDRAEREDRETPGRERGDKDEVKEEDEVERKPEREVEDRKPIEKEGRERIRDRGREKERDGEGEGEKRKKRVREHEKDRDSMGSLDGEGAGERDKDAIVSYGVQQRKRMLRPRGQSNPSNREARSRFRPKDTEGYTSSSSHSIMLNHSLSLGLIALEVLLILISIAFKFCLQQISCLVFGTSSLAVLFHKWSMSYKYWQKQQVLILSVSVMFNHYQ